MRLTFRSPMPASADALFRWHEQPGAFERLVPPWTDTRLVSFEGIRDGQKAVLRIGVGPVSVKWTAVHEGYVPGVKFEDRMRSGPFRQWHHVHRMEPAAPGASVLSDEIDAEPPFGALGRAVGGEALRRELTQQFGYRHRTTAADLAAHARYSAEPLRIAITGATGLIGRALTAFLTTGGHTVLPIVRTPTAGADEIRWDPRAGTIEADKLDGLDAVLHLAGEPVFSLRWSDEKKARILGSRERGTDLLARTLARLSNKPRVFVSASATGLYGDRGADVLEENAAPSERGFLPLVVRAWEAATAPAADAGIRTAIMRTGVVLTPSGGALQLMLPAFQLGAGGRIGDANTWLPWIGLDDVLGGYLHALASPEADGPFNLVAPNPVTMATLARTLAGILRRPAFVNVPGGVLSALSGEAAREMLLASARVVPRRLLEGGYAFRYPDLESALRHALGRPRPSAAFPGV